MIPRGSMVSWKGLQGHLSPFIGHFLQDRQFWVRFASSLSDLCKQKEGVPQGSILSPTLFSIKINSIDNAVNSVVDKSLYVDDFLMCYKSRNMESIERQLQHNLNKLQILCNENGFTFPSAKTVCVHICQLRGLHPDPSLTLNGAPIPCHDSAKFLGVHFDRKLNFLCHIKFLIKKCHIALNLLKVL